MKDSAPFEPWLGVFETLRVVGGIPLFMAEHRAELGRAMAALGLKSDFDFEGARAGLASLLGRWRWIVSREGTQTLFSEEAEVDPAPVALSVSPVRVGSCNWDARFKTLSYLSHAQAWKTAATPEVVLLNEHDHVASAARANIFWRQGEHLFTPAHEAGCRCGVVRGLVLNCGPVEAGHFSVEHLFEADEIFLTGSMKGIVSVNAIPGRSLSDFASADRLRLAYSEAVRVQLKAGAR